MKKLIVLSLLLACLFTIGEAQSNNFSVTLDGVPFYRDTLTSVKDTADIRYGASYANMFDTFQLEAKSSAVDTLTVWVWTADRTSWVQTSLILEATNAVVTTANCTSSWQKWLLIDPAPIKIRVVSTSDDASTTIFIVSAVRKNK
jgi:hypothetical protein